MADNDSANFMQPLPTEMTKHLDNIKTEDIDEFLERRVDGRDQNTIQNIFKRHLILNSQKKKEKMEE